ncbi:hypothetical protein COI10_01615 [Neisseria meningitidis]|uniref:Uncharacterized protein n=1 Tax=Neisseria meningitidis TaxID=487 RepID=A0A1V0GAA6_NEIME|nr:hypothetical protein CQR35_03600 [Neisseria meningitidis]EOC41799.1 hypothetical protein NM2001068_2157 [Neisseria meningitidis 2001068]ATL37672.1 hypothetical protein CQR34_06835 [Neisseria meningitidis]AUX07362.1 hypothetical protein BVD88_07040 [Neisseria meningitidis]EOC41828.1 hypothetical protein NM2001068_2186 [Neisseria meningitidis 2001068]
MAMTFCLFIRGIPDGLGYGFCRLKDVFPVGADSTCFKGRLSKQTERRLPGNIRQKPASRFGFRRCGYCGGHQCNAV